MNEIPEWFGADEVIRSKEDLERAVARARERADYIEFKTHNIHEQVFKLNGMETDQRIAFAKKAVYDNRKANYLGPPPKTWEDANFTFIISQERGYILDVQIKAMGETRRYQCPAMEVEFDAEEEKTTPANS
jgi:hypothetical protein